MSFFWMVWIRVEFNWFNSDNAQKEAKHESSYAHIIYIYIYIKVFCGIAGTWGI